MVEPRANVSGSTCVRCWLVVLVYGSVLSWMRVAAEAPAPDESANQWFALSSGAGASAATLIQLSTDPYTNTTSQHRTQVEPDTFALGSTIASAVPVGLLFNSVAYT